MSLLDLFTWKKQRPTAAPRRCRPKVEPLEDRLVLSGNDPVEGHVWNASLAAFADTPQITAVTADEVQRVNLWAARELPLKGHKWIAGLRTGGCNAIHPAARHLALLHRLAVLSPPGSKH